jgi:hypothetical protein
MAVSTLKQLRLLIVSQAGSMAAMAVVAGLKGRLPVGLLEVMLDGNYSDPNELALSIALSLPLCLALMFLTKSSLGKVAWARALPMKIYAIFRTESRERFLSPSFVAAT